MRLSNEDKLGIVIIIGSVLMVVGAVIFSLILKPEEDSSEEIRPVFDASACPPERPVYDSPPQQLQPVSALLASIITNQGAIEGEYFCMFHRDGRYLVVLDFRGAADPISELKAWFEENGFEEFGYDFSIICALIPIQILDQSGYYEPLCPEEEPQEEPGEQGGSGIVWRLSDLFDRRHFFSDLTKISKRCFNRFLVCEKRPQLKRHEELARRGCFFMP